MIGRRILVGSKNLLGHRETALLGVIITYNHGVSTTGCKRSGSRDSLDVIGHAIFFSGNNPLGTIYLPNSDIICISSLDSGIDLSIFNG